MALAGGPDSFLHHLYYQDQVEQTSPHSARELAGPGFPAQSDRLANHQEDDVDLEALVNDMNASLESLYSTCGMQSETAPRLQNGPHTRSQPPSGDRPLQPQVSPRQKVQRSQPMHILAVRCLQEEDQQFRTSSLPAIPNPFPELCGPGSPHVLTHGSLPPSQAAVKQVLGWKQCLHFYKLNSLSLFPFSETTMKADLDLLAQGLGSGGHMTADLCQMDLLLTCSPNTWHGVDMDYGN